MKKLFLLIAFLFISALTFAQNQVWVNGYTRSNGTYVQGHYRTAPNYTRNDNWTTVGNVNPHTGKRGYLRGDGYTTTRTYSSTPTYTRTTYTAPTYSAPTYTRTTYTTPTYSVPSPTPTYTTPTYSSSSYSTPSYSGSQTLYTGPRGGTYYINSNGNKSYVR